MSLDKRKDQIFVGENVTDLTGSTDSAKALADGSTNYVLTSVNANTGDVSIAADVNSDGAISQTIPRKAVLFYDFATDGGAQGEIVLRGDSLPADAVVTRGFFYVTTALTSGGSATIALNIPTDDAAGLLAATAIGTAGTAGGHECIQTGAVSAFSEITTAVRTPSVTVATADLIGGAFKLELEYSVMKADTSS